MKQILICQHGGSGNHGCEALARTVFDLIGQTNLPCQATLYSYKRLDDQRYLSDVEGLRIVGLEGMPGRFSLYNLSYHLKKKLGGGMISKIPITQEFQTLVKQADLVIAIGGDNYCYRKGEGYYPLDNYIRSQEKPYMLLGASVEPEDLPGALAEHLRQFDLITARETITDEALRQNGVDSVVLAPDSAFLLPRRARALPDGFVPGNTVGINLSPLIMKNEAVQGVTLENYRALVRDILENTDMGVALIPHVVWEGNDDRQAMRALYDEFAPTGRVVRVPDGSAPELKDAIAQLRFFIGARTHATIAAYSSGVPTLVVGYSIKAKGIAKDLFGDFAHYVLPVQDLRRPTDLKDAFRWVMEREDGIRQRLADVLPDYIARTERAADAIQKLLR